MRNESITKKETAKSITSTRFKIVYEVRCVLCPRKSRHCILYLLKTFFFFFFFIDVMINDLCQFQQIHMKIYSMTIHTNKTKSNDDIGSKFPSYLLRV